MRTVLAALLALFVLAGCATMRAADPDGETVQHYVWRSPTRIISDPTSADDLIVYLNPTDNTHALVMPRAGMRVALALGEQQTRFLLDRQKNETKFRRALINAFDFSSMKCSPTGEPAILPTRYAFEFTYRCDFPAAARSSP